jgi:hypothetical protein
MISFIVRRLESIGETRIDASNLAACASGVSVSGDAPSCARRTIQAAQRISNPRRARRPAAGRPVQIVCRACSDDANDRRPYLFAVGKRHADRAALGKK